MKVLLVGHAFAPNEGSEQGMTWNWAWHLSEHHEVWVAAYPQWRDEVEAQLAVTGNNRIHPVWVKPNSVFDIWDPHRGPQGLRWHYVLWQREVVKVAAREHGRIGFDVIHQVSLGTVAVPSRLWSLGAPFIWGPMGGGQTCPAPLLEVFGASRWLEYCRIWRMKLLPWLPVFRRAMANSASVLATNRETLAIVRAAGAAHSGLFRDIGIRSDQFLVAGRRGSSDLVNILWSGKLIKYKALPLALEAVAALDGKLPFRLVIAGDGPERRSCEAFAGTLGIIDRVVFLGRIDYREMESWFERADIFLFTSVRESGGMVTLEALCRGLPLVALDISGVRDHVPAEAGAKVPVGTRAETVKGLAAALEKLILSPELRASSGRAGLESARKYQWGRKALEMTEIYSKCVADAGRSSPPLAMTAGGSRPRRSLADAE